MTSEVDAISSKLSRFDLEDDLERKLNDKDEAQPLVRLLLDESTDDKTFKKLISSTPSKNSTFVQQLRLQLRQYDNMHRVLSRLQSLEDPKLINELLVIIDQNDVLINTVLQINKEMLRKETTSFQLTLLLSIITNYNTINKAYFTNLSVILASLDKSEEIRSLILLITIKLNEIDSDQLSLTVLGYLEDSILLDNDKVLLFDSLTLLFPVLPCVLIFVNTNENFKDLLTDLSLQISEMNANLINSILRFLAMSCIDEQMRNFVLKSYYPLLIKSFESSTTTATAGTNLETRVLICLIMTKVWNYTEKKYDLIKLKEVFVDALMNDIDVDTSLEGLLYLSLQNKIKESLRSNVDLVQKLVSLLKSEENSAKFGVLAILTNLSTYKDEDEDTTFSAKMFERSKQQDDNPSQIDSFLKSLANANTISSILSLANSINLKLQLIKLLRNFVHDKTIRSEVVKQGGLVFILEFLIQISSNLKYEPGTLNVSNLEEMMHPESRQIAIKSLLKILINNNPNLIFGKRVTPQLCIPFLCELLNDDHDRNVFELLIALINLSSLDDVSIKNLIIKTSFAKLQDLTMSSNKQLPKTAIELIANLSISPLMLEKFFDFEKPGAVKNYELMLNLMNSVSIEIQIATLNFFANVTEFEPLCLVLVEESKFVELIIEFFQNEEYLQNEVFLLRLVYILMNLIYAIQQKEAKLLQFRRNDLKNGILHILQTIKDEEILQMCINICNVIDFAKK